MLKDFHRHMDDPVVVRRLRDVGQKFSANRRTVIITAPSITIPAELGSLVEFLELPLPDKQRLRQIIDEMTVRVGKTRTLKRTLDAPGLDAMANNLRGLTEEEAERAASQAIVTRYGVTAETVTDVLQAKKELLRHSGMLEFIDASENLAAWAAWTISSAGWPSGAAPGKTPPANLAWSRRAAPSFWECRAAARACAPAPSQENGNCRW